MMMKKTILTLFFSVCCISSLAHALLQDTQHSSTELDKNLMQARDELLALPTPLSAEEIVEGLKDRNLDMTWGAREGTHFNFITKHDEVYFEIAFHDGFPDNFEISDEALFLEQKYTADGQTHTIYSYSYRLHDSDGEQVNSPLEQAADNPKQTSYTVEARRVIEASHPTIIDADKLSSFMQSGKFIFYTGAGLSAAAEVPTMGQLHALLGVEDDVNFNPALKKMVRNPSLTAANIKIFHDACFASPPTKAHFAVQELACLYKTQVVTENLDYLHERTGIMPYRIHADHLRTAVDPSSLKEIDYIICLGLSYDDRGFLGWYKKHHPNGKIISIDLKQPSYLGDEDFFLPGDLQAIMPTLLNAQSEQLHDSAAVPGRLLSSASSATSIRARQPPLMQQCFSFLIGEQVLKG